MSELTQFQSGEQRMFVSELVRHDVAYSESWQQLFLPYFVNLRISFKFQLILKGKRFNAKQISALLVVYMVKICCVLSAEVQLFVAKLLRSTPCHLGKTYVYAIDLSPKKAINHTMSRTH